MSTGVTVITITRTRPKLLLRAMESVRRQALELDGRLEHLVLVDDCEPTAAALGRMAGGFPTMRWSQIPRESGDQSGPRRLATLRNLAVELAATPWIAFLDDDNYLERSHVASLVARALATSSPAIHSERLLHSPDGSPYLEQRMPWKRDRTEGRRLYQELRDKGVFVAGSNVVHDRADPLGHPDPVRMVDTSEWLLARRLLLDLPFCEQYSLSDWEHVIPEDNKLLQRLIAERVPITSSRLPTLHYQLGGYSNAFEEGTPLAWRRSENVPPDQPSDPAALVET